MTAQTDVTDYEAVRGMVAEYRWTAWAIASSSIPPAGDWNRFVDLNMFGLMSVCHIIVPDMIERGNGRIIAIT